MARCKNCHKELTYNEIGATKKFISRACTEFLCRECLADWLDITPERVDEKITQFKEQHCTLFI